MLQRHIKRLLAFSRISLVGLLICRVGLLGHRALVRVAVRGLTAGRLRECGLANAAAALGRSSTGN